MTWQRPCGNGACVEWAFSGDVVHLRDSKDPSGPRLTFTRDEWAAFLHGVRTTRDSDPPARGGESE
nr:DUF397 domain-containing protein [Planosporangium thailandense]